MSHELTCHSGKNVILLCVWARWVGVGDWWEFDRWCPASRSGSNIFDYNSVNWWLQADSGGIWKF